MQDIEYEQFKAEVRDKVWNRHVTDIGKLSVLKQSNEFGIQLTGEWGLKAFTEDEMVTLIKELLFISVRDMMQSADETIQMNRDEEEK